MTPKIVVALTRQGMKRYDKGQDGKIKNWKIVVKTRTQKSILGNDTKKFCRSDFIDTTTTTKGGGCHSDPRSLCSRCLTTTGYGG